MCVLVTTVSPEGSCCFNRAVLCVCVIIYIYIYIFGELFISVKCEYNATLIRNHR